MINVDVDIEKALPNLFRDTRNDTRVFVEYWDVKGKMLATAIDNFINFDGDYTIYSSQHLDDIAHIFGFHPDIFWDNQWTKEQKAALFEGVYQSPYIWFNKGTEDVLRYIFNVFDINMVITGNGGFTVNVSTVNIDFVGDGNAYLFAHPLPTTPAKDYLIEQILNEFFPKGIERLTATFQQI
jgi:hypothetical protein